MRCEDRVVGLEVCAASDEAPSQAGPELDRSLAVEPFGWDSRDEAVANHRPAAGGLPGQSSPPAPRVEGDAGEKPGELSFAFQALGQPRCESSDVRVTDEGRAHDDGSANK